jgi:glycosyltransferase involved in cell wall biosynthesis
MKIAEVAPLFEAVPPRCYGGSERVVANLSEGLSRLGHEVTMFCSGDSSDSLGATVAPITPKALSAVTGDERDFEYDWASHYQLFHKVAERQSEFDVIHFHTNFFHFPFLSLFNTPVVTTVHFRLDRPELFPLYRRFQSYPFISISNSQRAPLPSANWVRTVYHGLPSERFPFGDGSDGYAVFLGRLSPVKGPDKAIEISKRAGLKLKIAAKINEWEQDYFVQKIKPHIDGDTVEYLGTVNEHEKKDLLSKASVLLFPINWPEPFGLVMIEAMACGTPVIAFNHGSVPEVVDDGVTGFVVNSVQEAVAAIKNLPSLDRRTVRSRFEQRFSARQMARDYLEAYEEVVQNHDAPNTNVSTENGASKASALARKVSVSTTARL